MLRKRKRKRNPDDIIDYLKNNSEDFEFLLSGGEGKVYLFVLFDKILLNDKFLLPRKKYVIKLYKRRKLTVKQIEYLELLSKYGLIPKIHIIAKNYIIMDYIEGEMLYDIRGSGSYKRLSIINDKIDNLIDVWESLGFSHGDLSDGNILVTSNNKVYFIDPYIYGSFL